jgi:hypothetical protein
LSRGKVKKIVIFSPPQSGEVCARDIKQYQSFKRERERAKKINNNKSSWAR